MTQTADVPNSNGNQVKLGTTGKIGSLMSKELESIKKSPHASASTSSSPRKLQKPPVSVPCGYSPRKSQPRKNSENGQKIETCKIELPDAVETEKRSTNLEKQEKKKKHVHIVEVVDIKCNNPMSSRIKKLGFSRLSESNAA